MIIFAYYRNFGLNENVGILSNKFSKNPEYKSQNLFFGALLTLSVIETINK